MAQNTEPESPPSPTEPIQARPVGGTEYSWCKAVPIGTGVTVLSLLLSKPPKIPILQNALHNLQNSHPILRSKLHLDPSNNTFHFLTPPSPDVHIQPFDLPSTAQILQAQSKAHHDDPFHTLLQHEMNHDTWRDPAARDTNVLYASTYTLSDDRYAVFLRLHTAACDRAAAVALLKELLRLFGGGGGGVGDEGKEEMVNLPVEDLIPEGKMNKPFWARGLDVLGYSLNALRFSNLSFVDAASPRRSSLVRLQMNADETKNLLAECKSRGIKLCGALAAAGMIAAWTSKCLPNDQREKYAVVTLVDCRPLLDPVLPSSHAGFYHSAILNTHDVCGENETLWELAKRSYTAFVNAMNCNKHFTDMSDLNFLMCKAIENPSLTPSSSLRTALISVFEDPVFDDSAEMHEEIGLKDYVGCASAHGVGPSIAIFDTIRNGKLDCACIYPSPLHSKAQIQGLVDNMKRILVEGCNCENQQIEP